MAAAQKTETPKSIAEELGVTPLQVRIYLRSQDKGVGRGSRYKFTPKQAAKIVAGYNKAFPVTE